MLIAVLGYSIPGQDSCRIVLIKKDTFSICPISVIKTANAAGQIMEGQAKTIKELETKVSKMQFESDVLKLQNNGLKASVSTQNRVNEELRKSNGSLLIDNNKQKKTIGWQKTCIYALSIVAIVEFFIIVIK